MAEAKLKVRITGLLVEDGKILLEKQSLKEQSHWNLPGGTLEFGETLEQGLVREMREETGLDVEVGELLYVCDRFKSLHNHVVDISFAIKRIGGTLNDTYDSDDGSEHILGIRMVPVSDLPEYGFAEKFVALVQQGFPQKGSYQGEFHAFYG